VQLIDCGLVLQMCVSTGGMLNPSHSVTHFVANLLLLCFCDLFFKKVLYR